MKPATQKNRQRVIDRLKKRAAYNRRMVLSGTSHLDCGFAMACQLRPELVQYDMEFNAAIRRLRRIDPEFPK